MNNNNNTTTLARPTTHVLVGPINCIDNTTPFQKTVILLKLIHQIWIGLFLPHCFWYIKKFKAYPKRFLRCLKVMTIIFGI